jgi:hypothetical protein
VSERAEKCRVLSKRHKINNNNDEDGEAKSEVEEEEEDIPNEDRAPPLHSRSNQAGSIRPWPGNHGRHAYQVFAGVFAPRPLPCAIIG